MLDIKIFWAMFYLQVSNLAVILNIAVAQRQGEDDEDGDDETEDNLWSEDYGAGAEVW